MRKIFFIGKKYCDKRIEICNMGLAKKADNKKITVERCVV